MRTLLNAEFKEMLSVLSEEGVDFLLIGAYALAVHGVPRATGDLDLWIRCRPDNALLAHRALAKFGAALEGIQPEELSQADSVIQIGIAPCRIDILTTIDGVDFEEAWSRRFITSIAGLQIPVLSREDLVRNKRATGRTQDKADLEALGETIDAD